MQPATVCNTIVRKAANAIVIGNTGTTDTRKELITETKIIDFFAFVPLVWERKVYKLKTSKSFFHVFFSVKNVS